MHKSGPWFISGMQFWFSSLDSTSARQFSVCLPVVFAGLAPDTAEFCSTLQVTYFFRFGAFPRRNVAFFFLRKKTSAKPAVKVRVKCAFVLAVCPCGMQTAVRFYLFPWVGTLPLQQQGYTYLAKIWQPRQNSGRQEVDMKQVTCFRNHRYWAPPWKKFGRPDDLAPVFCAPLSYTTFSSKVGWIQ